MAVLTDSVIPQKDGRPYPELPEGMSFWWANGTVTGDGTGGSAGINVSFNSALDNVWMPYVSVDHFGFVTHTAVVGGAGRCFAQATEWERTIDPAGGYPIAEVTGLVAEAAETKQGVASDMTPYYLGRAVQPTAARILIRFDNVDTAVYLVKIGGVFCDRPFVAQNYWRS